MRSFYQTEIRPLPAHDFVPLALSVDDRLPADIQLVLAYRNGLSQDGCVEALERGLRGFPHLTGKADCAPGKLPERIVPSEVGPVLEVVESPAVMDVDDLEALPLEEHAAAFIPQRCMPESLFRARLTLMPQTGFGILGLGVSHMAVDGTGLAWFIMHCTAALRGVEPPAVFHERRHGFGDCLDGPQESPQRYRACGAVADSEARTTPAVFAIRADHVRRHFHASSILDARLRLGAWLCTMAAERHPAFAETSLWCDPRGTHGIPAGYTGNAGCYLHFPLRDRTAEDLTRDLRSMTTRAGFQRIADTYRQIKRAEADGRPLVWDGPGNDILQLNLVPHAVAGTDFGSGLPAFALLLSRNSSGLRISLTPDASRFLIEACLPAGLGDSLAEACRTAGLQPSIWCRGRKMLECSRP
jgi:hypothetical protein